MRPLLLLALPLGLLLGLLLAGCSTVQAEHACPGDGCEPELAALADRVAALPGVTGVRRTARTSGLDNGTAARVEVAAGRVTRDGARQLAARVVELVLAAGLPEPSVIEVEVDADPLPLLFDYSFWATNRNWSRIRAR
jgi:hypothetical protein